jgi:hypothetical protein
MTNEELEKASHIKWQLDSLRKFLEMIEEGQCIFAVNGAKNAIAIGGLEPFLRKAIYANIEELEEQFRKI